MTETITPEAGDMDEMEKKMPAEKTVIDGVAAAADVAVGTHAMFYNKEEVIDTSAIDPVLSRKMHLVNDAMEEIGMTGFHWKLFCLNGFGYAVDSVSLPLQCMHLTMLPIAFEPSAH